MCAASSEDSYPQICGEVMWLHVTLDKPKYMIKLYIGNMS